MLLGYVWLAMPAKLPENPGENSLKLLFAGILC
jgi:hypothetical protein